MEAGHRAQQQATVTYKWRQQLTGTVSAAVNPQSVWPLQMASKCSAESLSFAPLWLGCESCCVSAYTINLTCW